MEGAVSSQAFMSYGRSCGTKKTLQYAEAQSSSSLLNSRLSKVAVPTLGLSSKIWMMNSLKGNRDGF